MAQHVFTTSNALADIVANGVALQDLSSNIFSKMDALAPYRFRAGEPEALPNPISRNGRKAEPLRRHTLFQLTTQSS